MDGRGLSSCHAQRRLQDRQAVSLIRCRASASRGKSPIGPRPLIIFIVLEIINCGISFYVNNVLAVQK